MSERQKNILEYIKSYTEENQYPPTIREIATAVGLKSSSTVHGHLDRLKEKGYVNFVASSPRTLTVVI
ncbi:MULTISPECIES: winged helix-turn-helix transcriptional regulator [unclassified Sporosarcina]|uniref:LexA family protein n=1 Tax=unclassified Sporosarcina TaxID=2647733 RepID=UPI001A9187C4|nr:MULTISPECIES: winged helix-turn-helix transcriptional regulator [unclassified Sporosarcina]MBO0588178.1 winged helix-turn-helix transcriptional regulator [Sporosarcina sp. E16_8]MBO0601932.1 winged helix-turn-helix transcriptional regulator [Sporosarcina sp. E16_3]